MSSPAYELAQYLAAQGVGEFAGNTPWSLHVSREPANPSDVVTLYDTTAADPLVADPDIRQPGLQVRARSDDYLAAFDVQNQIHALLAQPGDAELDVDLARTIGDGRYIAVNLVGDIIAIGRDDNDRHLVVANYRLIRQPLEGS